MTTPYTQISDSCPHCGRNVLVPLASVTINYHRTDDARDRYEWMHDGCPLVVKPYTPRVAELLEPVVDQRSCRIGFIDAEYDDDTRLTAAPIRPVDEAGIVRDIERGP